MRPEALQSSPRTISYATAAALADTDALHASTATSTNAITYTAAQLIQATWDPPIFASIKTTSSVSTYRTGSSYPIVVTGTYGGEVVVDSLVLTQANGNETIVGNQAFDAITSTYIPGQLGTGGFIELGRSGVACKKRHGKLEPYRAVEAIGSGNLHVGYDSGYTDTLPSMTGQVRDIEPIRIYGDSTIGVVLYV
jgi:hypothetical protein